MTKLTSADIRHLAALSRIAINPEDEEIYRQQLSAILQYVEQLNQIDTSGLEPTSQVTGLTSVSRPDSDTGDTMPTADLLAQAPQVKDNNLKVPKVL